MHLGRVVPGLAVAGDHDPPPHNAVVLGRGVQEVGVEEENISRFHFYIDVLTSKKR